MADNINISPDMINNLMNMLNNSNKDTNNSSVDSTKNTTETGIKLDNLQDIISSFSSNSNSSENNDSINSNNNSLDFDTLLKLKSIMEKMNNKNDPRSNLLYSLKPYLRESKRSKLDQYANLLKITQVTGLFSNDKEK